MNLKRILAFALCGIAAIMLSACGTAAPIRATVPTNVAELGNTEPGKSLVAMGYTPAVDLYKDDAVAGVAYIVCGNTKNISDCAKDINNRGTNERPVVYTTNDGKVTELVGAHDNGEDDRSFHMTVPDSWQDFKSLNADQKTTLLTKTMPVVAKALGTDPSGNTSYTVDIDGVGRVTAWVQR